MNKYTHEKDIWGNDITRGSDGTVYNHYKDIFGNDVTVGSNGERLDHYKDLMGNDVTVSSDGTKYYHETNLMGEKVTRGSDGSEYLHYTNLFGEQVTTQTKQAKSDDNPGGTRMYGSNSPSQMVDPLDSYISELNAIQQAGYASQSAAKWEPTNDIREEILDFENNRGAYKPYLSKVREVEEANERVKKEFENAAGNFHAKYFVLSYVIVIICLCLEFYWWISGKRYTVYTYEVDFIASILMLFNIEYAVAYDLLNDSDLTAWYIFFYSICVVPCIFSIFAEPRLTLLGLAALVVMPIVGAIGGLIHKSLNERWR